MNPLTVGIPLVGAAALLAVSESGANPLSYDSEGSSSPIDYSTVGDKNLAAMRSLILEGESGGNYRALVGGGSFSDYSHHPGWTNAAMSVKSDWDGWNNSHAAGGYQFQPQTFKEISDSLGLNGDFSPQSQDNAADALIIRRGALDDILSSNFFSAVDKLRDEWDFFNHWDNDRLSSTYQSYGGTIV